MDYCVVLVTVSSETEAKTIARTLVEERLAACVNIIPGLTSIYRWEEKICEDRELLLVIKTQGQKVATLISKELTPGTYSADWNGTADNGTALGSGVYAAGTREPPCRRRRSTPPGTPPW